MINMQRTAVINNSFSLKVQLKQHDYPLITLAYCKRPSHIFSSLFQTLRRWFRTRRWGRRKRNRGTTSFVRSDKSGRQNQPANYRRWYLRFQQHRSHILNLFTTNVTCMLDLKRRRKLFDQFIYTKNRYWF